MYSFFKKLFKKKTNPPSEESVYVDNLMNEIHDINGYAETVVELCDSMSMNFENTFKYEDNDKIYIVLANIFAKFSDSIQFNEQEEELHREILSMILVRYGINDNEVQEKRWNEFMQSINYFSNVTQNNALNKKPNSPFVHATMYAQFLYPNVEESELITQSISILRWMTILGRLTGYQKKYYALAI
jgi:hypothetical protein